MTKARIVATIGPVTNNAESLRELASAGMSVVRLNGSHNTLDWHAETIALVRDTLPTVPILFDIPGQKIRTASLAVEPMVARGDLIVLTLEAGHDGSKKISIEHAEFYEGFKAGDTVFADDGSLYLSVEKVDGQDIYCRAEMSGQIRSRKGIAVPYLKMLRTGLITERDKEMVKFACEHGVDFLGISFVESARHVQAVRGLTGNGWPRIVSKIENQGGMERMEEILAATDVAMIDRGDLAMTTNMERVALFQKRILEAARRASKPVIVATEMLHTMIENPVPTKAEISDITNAVLDGCAVTMLSGETAVGANPVEAVSTMQRIMEAAIDHLQPNSNAAPDVTRTDPPEAMNDAVALICRELPITKIVAITKSGYAASIIAVRRPRQPILAVSNDPMTARSANLLPGTEGIYLDIPFSRTSTDHIVQSLKELWRSGKLLEEDLVLVAAVGYPRAGNRMNLLQTHLVRDLVEAMEWSR